MTATVLMRGEHLGLVDQTIARLLTTLRAFGSHSYAHVKTISPVAG